MKISLQAAQATTPTDITNAGAKEIVRLIGAQLGAVENVIDWGKKYDGVVVAKVVHCEKHPNADKLSVCLIDDGGVVSDVPRNNEGCVQVVCGAPNVKAGLIVAWLPPGSTVPSTANEPEPFVLEPRELRGIVSNGMIASASELGISDDHGGILEINDNIPAGTSFKTVFKLDDTVIDLENKMFTHRPDCFGTIGVARELAGIQQKPYKSPDWYLHEPTFNTDNSHTLAVDITTNLVSRFSAVILNNVVISPSSIWLQIELTKVGIRPINSIVDITNWVMHLTGQPLHAYDYDKFCNIAGTKEPTIQARLSKKGESITVLNGKTITFEDDSTVVICSNDTPVGIGGVMGGADTEVDDSTQTIILEAATFDMYAIRRTAMKYGLFTEAVTRFNKGQSPLQTTRALAYAAQLITEISKGTIASPLADYKADTVNDLPAITVDTTFINDRLGTQLSAELMASLLNNVECSTKVHNQTLTISVPFWRRDLHIPEDIVEEVGRLYGYSELPVDLPLRSSLVTPRNQDVDFANSLRDYLSAMGANEVLSYSFVHKNLLESATQDTTKAFQINNAISPDLQYYRLSLVPSLLGRVHSNHKAGFEQFALFEIGKAHQCDALDNTGLPVESMRLAFVWSANSKQATTLQAEPYYYARHYVESLMKKLLVSVDFISLESDTAVHNNSQIAQPFLATCSAQIISKNGDPLGIVGEFKQQTVKDLKLPGYCAGFELDITALLKYVQATPSSYQPIARYPKVKQDITLETSITTPYNTVYTALKQAIADVQPSGSTASIEPVDIFQSDDSLRYSYRVTISNTNRTLNAQEVNSLLDTVGQRLAERITAQRI